MLRLHKISTVLITLLIIITLFGCQSQAAPTQPAAPPENTPLPVATATSSPTLAPVPSDTASPTQTELPSATLLPTLTAGDTEHTLQVGELERSYWLHTPPGLLAESAVPVVFAFHGLGGNATTFEIIGLEALADEQGFLIVTPSGLGVGNARSWNAGFCCGVAVTNKVDEIAFVRAILEDLQSTYSLDVRRIYATGHSNGGMLSYRLGCEMADTFAAVAPLAGLLSMLDCQPSEPVSLVHVHGAADRVVPISGSGQYGANFYMPPIADNVATWAKLNGCDPLPQVQIENGITHTVYGGCTGDVSVELYAIDGLSHALPSAYQFPLAEVLWEFFSAHPKP